MFLQSLSFTHSSQAKIASQFANKSARFGEDPPKSNNEARHQAAEDIRGAAQDVRNSTHPADNKPGVNEAIAEIMEKKAEELENRGDRDYPTGGSWWNPFSR